MRVHILTAVGGHKVNDIVDVDDDVAKSWIGGSFAQAVAEPTPLKANSSKPKAEKPKAEKPEAESETVQ